MARIVRLLVYEGSEDWVKKTIDQSHVKGVSYFGAGNVIKSVILGSLPDEVTVLVEELNDGS